MRMKRSAGAPLCLCLCAAKALSGCRWPGRAGTQLLWPEAERD